MNGSSDRAGAGWTDCKADLHGLEPRPSREALGMGHWVVVLEGQAAFKGTRRSCHRAENWERVTCRGLAQFCWQSKLMDIWHKVQKQHFCLALFAFRANTGRLEFPLGLSPTQTGLAEAFN